MLNIVVFSGAGMSAESGIDTFRKTGGLWEQYRIEEVATPEAWHKEPEKVQAFYNMRRREILAASPNKGHRDIKELEQFGQVIVITQNIDDLHERSGSKNVLHLHGNIRYAKSSGPNQEKAYYRIEGDALSMEQTCPEGYILRPHVVWFGEDVPAYGEARSVIEKADILIVIGTSLQVYPAAGLIYYASQAKLKVIIDPDNDLNVPNDFIKINSSASEGIETCLHFIKDQFDPL